MKTLSLHPVSLLVGTALALTVGAQAVQRTAVIAPPVQAATLDCPTTVPWPPHPDDRFQFSAKNLPGAYQPSLGTEWMVDLGANEDRLIYSVPENRWLVVSHINALAKLYVAYPDGSTEETNSIVWLEAMGGVLPPMSEIHLQNTASSGTATWIDILRYFVSALPTTKTKQVPWPPHPKDRFRLSAKNVPGAYQSPGTHSWRFDISAGTDQLVFAVPSDRWVVMTEVDSVNTGDPNLLYYLAYPDGSTDFIKWPSWFPWPEGTNEGFGVAVPPATEVRVLGLGSQLHNSFYIHGYFVEA